MPMGFRPKGVLARVDTAGCERIIISRAQSPFGFLFNFQEAQAWQLAFVGRWSG
jgi:hypothetical protein